MEDYLTISELIGMVQDELIKSQQKRLEAGKAPLFQTDELELEINTQITTDTGGKIVLGIPVFSTKLSISLADKEMSTQRIKLKFKVVEDNGKLEFKPQQSARMNGRLPKLEE